MGSPSQRGWLADSSSKFVADVLADILQQCGALVRMEVYVPAATGGTKEAWLDPSAYGLPNRPDLLFDVTVRHPRNARRLAGRTAGRKMVERPQSPPRGDRCT